MTTLTITAKGQITLKREVLEHLGLQPGSRVEVDLLPNGKVGLVGVLGDQPLGDHVAHAARIAAELD